MLVSSIPAKFSIPFGNGAGGAFIRSIPTASQIGVQNGAASLTDGFPPLTMTPVASGGTPPFGQDMNGILKQTTAWSQWYSAGGPVAYDAAFQSAIGGYPNGAVVQSATTAGIFWVSTTDSNVTNPDAGGAGWVKGSLYGTLTTGDFKITWKNVADPGFILINDGSIGSASSGASFASALAQPLYTVCWANISQSFAVVAGGRGASAAADFAANKPMTLPKILGRAIIIAGSGAGLTAISLGQWLGENNHTLLVSEIPQLAASVTASGTLPVPVVDIRVWAGLVQNTGFGGGSVPTQGITNGGSAVQPINVSGPITASVNTTGLPSTGTTSGGGAAHNNMQPSFGVNVELAL